MSAPESTIWPIQPHTEAKHRILREWWNAWLPKLAITYPRVIYFDGFAGPGVYEGGELGSPIIALRCALEHLLRPKFESKELVFYFVEQREDRIEVLKAEIQDKCRGIPHRWTVEPIQADFVETLAPVLNRLNESGTRMAPVFAFLDPFGFKDLPMDLVAGLLRHRWCDVLITFQARDINRFAESQFHERAIDLCLGGSDWRDCLPAGADARRTFFLTTYEEEIQRRVPVAHVRSFEISGLTGPIYHLVGATKNKEGVKVMKRAMWVADPTGNYRFSDTTAGIRTLLEWADESAWVEAATNAVLGKFEGQTTRVVDVEDFVLYVTPYQFKREIVHRLISRRDIIDVRGRGPKGGLNDNTTLVFR